MTLRTLRPGCRIVRIARRAPRSGQPQENDRRQHEPPEGDDAGEYCSDVLVANAKVINVATVLSQASDHPQLDVELLDPPGTVERQQLRGDDETDLPRPAAAKVRPRRQGR